MEGGAKSKVNLTSICWELMLTILLTQGRVHNGPPAPFEIVLGEAPGRLAVAAEVDGNAPVHADGNGRPENSVRMRARAVAAFEHVAQRPLDHDTGKFAARQLPQLGVEPFPGADDGGDEVRHGLAFHRHPRFAAIQRIIPGGKGATDCGKTLGIEGIRLLFPRIDDDGDAAVHQNGRNSPVASSPPLATWLAGKSM